MSTNKLSNKFHLLLLAEAILNFFHFFLLYDLHSLCVSSLYLTNKLSDCQLCSTETANHCMNTVPVESTSQSDYSFLNYANKKNQNESMLIKKNQNEWKSFDLPTQTWKNHIVFAYFWMSIFASRLVTIPNNGDELAAIS